MGQDDGRITKKTKTLNYDPFHPRPYSRGMADRIKNLNNHNMKKTQLFDPNQFYIIRADKAGVFMGKIESLDNGTAVCNSLRRLYYWEGALDVTQIAANGVARPASCKFSTQMGEEDKSTIFNLIEFHPASEKAITSINSVKEWIK